MEPRLGEPGGEDSPFLHPVEAESRKSRIWWVVIVVILGGAAAAYYWQQSLREPAPPPSAQTQSPPTPPSVITEPAIRHPIEEAPGQPLPALGDSDAAVRDALAGLLGEKSWEALFYPDRMIRRIVATIDNLPRKKAPVRMMPLKPAPRAFVTAGTGNDAIIGRDNAMRYAPYVSIAQAVDAQKLVAAYTRLYPLFQRAYEELGYSKGYFNDRLVEALDDMLNAPDVREPIKLVQPKVFYEFADPDLEARSAGQKIMIRIGHENATRIKEKLREIRNEVTRRGPN